MANPLSLHHIYIYYITSITPHGMYCVSSSSHLPFFFCFFVVVVVGRCSVAGDIFGEVERPPEMEEEDPDLVAHGLPLR